MFNVDEFITKMKEATGICQKLMLTIFFWNLSSNKSLFGQALFEMDNIIIDLEIVDSESLTK